MNVKRGLRAVMAAFVGLVAAGVVATPSFATTGPMELLRNGKGTTGGQPLYLTATGTAGSQVTVKSSLGTSSLQRWYMEYDFSTDLYVIRNQSGYALSIQKNNSTPGTNVLTWYYEPTNRYQQWEWITTTGYPQYRNVGTGLCLATTGGTASSTPSGSRVIIWGCGAGADQRWTDVWV